MVPDITLVVRLQRLVHHDIPYGIHAVRPINDLSAFLHLYLYRLYRMIRGEIKAWIFRRILYQGLEAATEFRASRDGRKDLFLRKTVRFLAWAHERYLGRAVCRVVEEEISRPGTEVVFIPHHFPTAEVVTKEVAMLVGTHIDIPVLRLYVRVHGKRVGRFRKVRGVGVAVHPGLRIRYRRIICHLRFNFSQR